MTNSLLIVTGASRGIGREISNQLCGFFTKSIFISTKNHIQTHIDDYAHSKQIYLNIDISNFVETKKFVTDCIGKLGVDFDEICVALCAARIGDPGGVCDADFENWISTFSVNVLGNLNLIKTLLKINQNARYKVAFFAGGGAAYGYPEFSSYSLSKVATVRAVENLSIETQKLGHNFSIIAIAPGAVATDMLATVIKHGGAVKTLTDINEPVDFVRRFFADELPTNLINGRFVHVRDKLDEEHLLNAQDSKFFLRRIE